MRILSLLVLSAVCCATEPTRASTLPANVVDFNIESVGSTGTITGIDSTAGVHNYVEIQIPAESIFSITLGAANGGSFVYLDSYGNSGGFWPTGTGYSYSTTTSSVGAGFFSPVQNAGSAQLEDSNGNPIGTITPGFLQSSALLLFNSTSGVATFENDQTGGPATLEIDFAGLNTSNSTAAISASFSVQAVPLPDSAVLFLSALAGLSLLGFRSRRGLPRRPQYQVLT